jgi:methylase of polypeptide subunit release factors
MQTTANLPASAPIDHVRVINVGGGGGGLGGLREAFLAAGYTVDGVADRLGPVAGAALQRHETVPARRATARGDALDLLLRLFPLQLPVDERNAAAVLPVEALLTAGLVERSAGELRAVLDVRPYREAVVGHGGEADGPAWWVVSDLGTGLDGRHRPLAGEHVLGVGGASTTLAQVTVREAVDRTLDVGTGCGVQALHASRHSASVVATDVSARALRLAAMTAGLSGVRLELRAGDLLRPVAGETFDLVVSNPPFVVGAPPGDLRHTYRDAGLDLDGVGARLSHDGPALLAPGGTLQMLANWVHLAGESWEERVAGWLPGQGVDALVVQREVLDPAEYVATWLRDAGEEGSAGYVEHYDTWLAALEDAGVEGIGFGLVNVRRTDDERRLTLLDWPHPVQQPLGPHVDAWFRRQRWLADHDTDDRLLAAVLVLATDVLQEQVGAPGAEDPAHLVLRQQVGLRRAVQADTATAALAGACDGQLGVGTLVAAVQQVLGEEPDTDAPEPGAVLLDRVRDLVEAGVLRPPV